MEQNLHVSRRRLNYEYVHLGFPGKITGNITFCLLILVPGCDPARLQRLHLIHVDVADHPDGIYIRGPLRNLLPHLKQELGFMEFEFPVTKLSFTSMGT